MRRKMLVLAGLGLAFPATAVAQTSTQTQTMTVTMTVTAGCTVSAGTLAFGTHSSLLANVDQQGAFTVNCTNTTPYVVALDPGANSASVATRRMKGGASNTEFVGYQLYADAARTANWGVTTGTDTLAGTGIGSSQNLTVYGRIPPQTLGSPGSYADTVTITVTY